MSESVGSVPVARGIETGAVVWLKSGGLPMVVDAMANNNHSAKVIWHSQGGLQSAHVSVKSLSLEDTNKSRKQ